jgi:hypothetical protein
VGDAFAEARKRLKEAVHVFEKVAARALDAAADPKVPGPAVADARTQTTFALAAVGAAFKAALKAARPAAEE